MDDYIQYIDNNAILLGSVALEVGDIELAKNELNRALNRLRRYQGDRMQPAYMAQHLVKKLELAQTKPANAIPVLKYERWLLSKTDYMSGLQCPKKLFLSKYKRQEQTPPDAKTKELFKQGHNFEDTFRVTEFPEGMNIKELLGSFFYFNSYTKYLLGQLDEVAVFEASFIEDEVLVMCDVVHKNKEHSYDFYEIKLHSQLNDTLVNDLAIQYYVCNTRFSSQINSFNIVLRREEGEKPWQIIDLKDRLETKLAEVAQNLNTFKAILSQQDIEPEITMGNHCQSPYKCPFMAYCEGKNR